METLKAIVECNLIMRENETPEEAATRLYDLLYDGLVNVADHIADFWISSADAE